MDNNEWITDLLKRYDYAFRWYAQTGDKQYFIEMVEEAIKHGIETPKGTDVKGLMEALTDSEKAAFDAISAEIGTEGNISIQKMVQQTGISRPVFTSLLNKMEKHQVAFIKNQGVKGTYICIRME